MRVSREEAQASRKRIIQEAARLMRENGISATSVADVMTAAGMTTGGFYSISTRRMTSPPLPWAQPSQAFSAASPGRRRHTGQQPHATTYPETCLSQAHADHPGKGRPGSPRLALDAGPCRATHRRSSSSCRYGGHHRAARRRHTHPGPGGVRPHPSDVGSLVGAVIIARAVGDGPLREEVLAAVRGRRSETGTSASARDLRPALQLLGLGCRDHLMLPLERSNAHGLSNRVTSFAQPYVRGSKPDMSAIRRDPSAAQISTSRTDPSWVIGGLDQRHGLLRRLT